MASFMAIFFMGPLRAQMADEYSFEVSAESYNAIDGSVLYLSYPSSGSEELFLPFSFHYCGYNYTAIRVCADGLITFGSPPLPITTWPRQPAIM